MQRQAKSENKPVRALCFSDMPELWATRRLSTGNSSPDQVPYFLGGCPEHPKPLILL